MTTIHKLLYLSGIISISFLSCTNNTNKISSDTTDTISQEVDSQNSIIEKKEKASPLSVDFKSEDGKTVNTLDLRGKVVFMNFWATWCPPCRKEMPAIQVLYDKFKSNEHITFLIVEIENDVEGTKKFLTEENLSLPIYYPQADIPKEWVSDAIPTTVILDKNGKIAAKQQGMYDFASKEVEEFVQNLINQ